MKGKNAEFMSQIKSYKAKIGRYERMLGCNSNIRCATPISIKEINNEL